MAKFRGAKVGSPPSRLLGDKGELIQQTVSLQKGQQVTVVIGNYGATSRDTSRTGGNGQNSTFGTDMLAHGGTGGSSYWDGREVAKFVDSGAQNGDGSAGVGYCMIAWQEL